MIISCKNISKSYGVQTVLENITFSVEEGEKSAFVGLNGAGKTTLFKIMAGEIKPDGGEIIMPKGTTVAYLTQNASYESGLSVHDEMLLAFSDIIETEKKMRETESALSALSPGSAEYAKLAEQYDTLARYYVQSNGYSYKSLVRGVISGLGLDGSQKISSLSGGQKTRVALGRELLKKPDVLLLDEPTNHLDVSSLSWLETYLKSYGKTVLIISHDRYFMDAVVLRVIDVENGKASSYTGAYSAFIERKRANFAIAQKHFKDNQKELKKQEESIRLLKSYNRQKTVKRAESMEKRLAKTERLEKPVTGAGMSLSLSPKIESGNDVLFVNSLSKSYGCNKLFENVSFEIKKGEKVALIGANGIGKTTLLKIIMNEESPDAGNTRRGVNVITSYYDQERQSLDGSKTLIQQISDVYPGLTDGEIRSMLAAFLFRGDDVYKQISSLSGGEAGRASLAILMLARANLLILDEPTNHLDTYSKEILENALAGYTGTILCVSHDRYFINRVATRVLELHAGGVKSYMGGYDYYIQKKSDEIEAGANGGEAVKPVSSQKSDWLEKKAESAAARKKEAALKKIEAQIEEAERKIKECDEMMCDSAVFTNAVRAKETYDLKNSLESALEALYAEWDKVDGSL